MRDSVPPFVDLIGKPFAYGGRGPDTFDCFGLVRELHARRGIHLGEFVTPRDQQEMALCIASVQHNWQEIGQPEPNAVVLIQLGRFVCHMGYVTGDGTKMLHAWEGSGGVTHEPLSLWTRRIVGYFRRKT